MQTCTKDYLPGMMKGGADGKKKYDLMDKAMKDAVKLAK